MPDNTSEKRHFHRIFYNSDVTISSDSNIYSCKLIDLSLQGCLLRFDTPWTHSADALYTLKLQLSEECDITMKLSVAHVVDNTVGFKCEHIDIDSISHLRRLVELNLGDSELLERDLLALAELPLE